MITSASDLAAKNGLDSVWREYKTTSSVELKNYLIESYLYLVNGPALVLWKRMPPGIDIDDLKSEGTFGLMNSVVKFDIDRNVKFETFSQNRIRGAMDDYLRSIDCVTRQTRLKESVVNKVKDDIMKEFGRKPYEEELLEAIGKRAADIPNLQKDARKILEDSRGGQTVRLQEIIYDFYGGAITEMGDLIHDRSTASPLLNMMRKDLKHMLGKSLTRKERLVVALYFYEDFTQKEVGEVMERCDSTITLIHKKIMNKLIRVLEGQEEEFLLDSEAA